LRQKKRNPILFSAEIDIRFYQSQNTPAFNPCQGRKKKTKPDASNKFPFLEYRYRLKSTAFQENTWHAFIFQGKQMKCGRKIPNWNFLATYEHQKKEVYFLLGPVFAAARRDTNGMVLHAAPSHLRGGLIPSVH